MGLFKFEHGRAAYRADFVFYGATVVALTALLLTLAPRGHTRALAAALVAGLLGWSLVEYGLHRFVLHGMAPLRDWHREHHARPAALICTPTLVSATLIGLLVFLPAALLADRWVACALTVGLLLGYLAYAVTHHAIHHAQGGGEWLRRRKRWHSRHHRSADGGLCFGVTSGFWDRVFGTVGRVAGVRHRTDAVTAHAYNPSVAEPLHSNERTTP